MPKLSTTFMILLIVSVVTFSSAQQTYYFEKTCQSPRGVTGYCISIRECPSLVSLLQSNPLGAEDRKYLQDSQCGNGESGPLACCEPESLRRCTSPTGSPGFCISFHDCPPLVALAQLVPLQPAERKYLQDAQCGKRESTPLVCCVPVSSS